MDLRNIMKTIKIYKEFQFKHGHFLVYVIGDIICKIHYENEENRSEGLHNAIKFFKMSRVEGLQETYAGRI